MKQMITLLTMLVIANTSFSKMIKHESKLSFAQATQALELAFKEKGLTVFAKIDHQKAAESVQLSMNPATVYIFGNPRIGTLLMNDNIEWTYELPLKIAVFQEKDGTVWLSTRDLAKDIKSPTQKERIKTINALLKSLIQQ